MLRKKKQSKKSPKEAVKTQNPNTKLINAYQAGISIQAIADDNDMTTAQVTEIVVNQ